MIKYIQLWCNKHGVTRPSFLEWKQAAISDIHRKINHLLTKLATAKGKKTLNVENAIFTEELEMLHNKFVALPTIKQGIVMPLSSKSTILKF